MCEKLPELVRLSSEYACAVPPLHSHSALRLASPLLVPQLHARTCCLCLRSSALALPMHMRLTDSHEHSISRRAPCQEIPCHQRNRRAHWILYSPTEMLEVDLSSVYTLYEIVVCTWRTSNMRACLLRHADVGLLLLLRWMHG